MVFRTAKTAKVLSHKNLSAYGIWLPAIRWDGLANQTTSWWLVVLVCMRATSGGCTQQHVIGLRAHDWPLNGWHEKHYVVKLLLLLYSKYITMGSWLMWWSHTKLVALLCCRGNVVICCMYTVWVVEGLDGCTMECSLNNSINYKVSETDFTREACSTSMLIQHLLIVTWCKELFWTYTMSELYIRRWEAKNCGRDH